jgi:long-subunit fatty acid transport protein
MNQKARKLLFILSFCPFLGTQALADAFHYKNILVGERAAGLGGAFTAISDDPSGVFHNPAGLIFSMENYFSLSANGYVFSTTEYQEIVGSQNYTYTSQGLVPVFFGISQNLGKGKIAFAMVVPNSDFLDQEDTIIALSTSPDRANTLKRKVFRQDLTYVAGPAYARELFKNFTFGFSLLGFARFDRAIDNQLIIFNPLEGDDLKEGRYFIQNTHFTRAAYGLTPKLGIQFMPLPKWSLGLTADMPINLSGSQSGQQIATQFNNEERKPAELDGTFDKDIQTGEWNNIAFAVPTPFNLALGSAYFLSKDLLVTGDVFWHSESNQLDAGADFVTASTFNWALGTEYYLSPSWALRLGAYSDNANTPTLSSALQNQNDHVNLLGGTLSVSFMQPGSSVTLGGGYSRGTGQGQAIGGTAAIQTVVQQNLMFYFAGSYQL